MRIEIVYAQSSLEQDLREIELKPDANIREAIELSGMLDDYPHIDIDRYGVGVFSKRAGLDDRLSEGDRVEIYRSLVIDPKEARRRRAEERS